MMKRSKRKGQQPGGFTAPKRPEYRPIPISDEKRRALDEKFRKEWASNAGPVCKPKRGYRSGITSRKFRAGHGKMS